MFNQLLGVSSFIIESPDCLENVPANQDRRLAMFDARVSIPQPLLVTNFECGDLDNSLVLRYDETSRF